LKDPEEKKKRTALGGNAKVGGAMAGTGHIEKKGLGESKGVIKILAPVVKIGHGWGRKPEAYLGEKKRCVRLILKFSCQHH